MIEKQKSVLNLPIIGAASGVAAQDHGCGDGPYVLQRSPYWQPWAAQGLSIEWSAMIQPQNVTGTSTTKIVSDWCQDIAHVAQQLVLKKQRFAVLGGDHACAVGTWSGVWQALATLNPGGQLGLIWIDAHLDSHTFETTESDAIHGMPVAALLGHGDPLLVNVAGQSVTILPENLVFIGIRSYEPGEHEFVKRLGIKVYYMDEVKQRGVESVLREAITQVQKNTVAFGISLDLDAIDPSDAPGVGSPESGGISGHALSQALAKLEVANNPNFVAFEVVEFNPHHDREQRTEKLVCELVAMMSGGKV